jgi:hypothetical protein
LGGTAGQYEPLRLMVVAGASADSRVWMELMERHHHLGYRVRVGAQLRSLVRAEVKGERVLPCLQCTSAAWQMAARGRWIGWNAEQRARNLLDIVNNSSVPDSALGACETTREEDPGALRPPTAPGSAAAIWLPAPATGDPGGRPALRRDLLSGRQLDPARPNARAGPDGPLSPSGSLRPQAAAGLPALP